mmetsp:Transcript_71142/g.231041  ORF Transcript_71142/g.231041 Transcript_71142/m.231041 type:complete len:257 (-) Transcript_71142:4044-4814(-)
MAYLLGLDRVLEGLDLANVLRPPVDATRAEGRVPSLVEQFVSSWCLFPEGVQQDIVRDADRKQVFLDPGVHRVSDQHALATARPALLQLDDLLKRGQDDTGNETLLHLLVDGGNAVAVDVDEQLRIGQFRVIQLDSDAIALHESAEPIPDGLPSDVQLPHFVATEELSRSLQPRQPEVGAVFVLDRGRAPTAADHSNEKGCEGGFALILPIVVVVLFVFIDAGVIRLRGHLSKRVHLLCPSDVEVKVADMLALGQV